MSTHHTKKLQNDNEEFMQLLTPSFKEKVIGEMMHAITEKNFILKTLIGNYVKS